MALSLMSADSLSRRGLSAWTRFLAPQKTSVVAGACCLLLLCAPVEPAHAESIPDSTSVEGQSVHSDSLASPVRWYSMFTNIPNDWARFGASTFRTENIPAIVGMTVLTAGLIAADDETWTLSHRWYRSHGPTRGVSDFFEYLGDGRPQFGLAAAFGAYGLVFADRRSVRTGSQLVEAILSCGVVVQVLKHITGRESPFVSTVPGGRWAFFPNQTEYHRHVPRFDAYPSGHIATALATVTVIAENYPEWKWVRPVGYSICALIGISMANTGIHWYSDYPLGLFLGYTFGMIVAHPGGDAGCGTSADRHVVVRPALVLNGAGIGLSLRF
jgi:membrane-associated PAP2 superfamily phosphatase